MHVHDPTPPRRPLLAVLGPTATGKSALALAVAERLGGEIVNCDSTAVYRGFDIGTDKVPVAARRGIPHHLIDIVDPVAEYTAADFGRDAARIIDCLRPGDNAVPYRWIMRGAFPAHIRGHPIHERPGGTR